eukprot:Nitzschia sp. Nitz4//scaffold87_size112219//104331//107195//NITZ4_004092-RA/size112219-processed-gene-0.118-mRNA-1//1//CDS//3329559423//8448//frame0
MTVKLDNRSSPFVLEECSAGESDSKENDESYGECSQPTSFQPYLESLMKALAKRESVMGRYCHVTALTYSSIGNAYRQLEEHRAITFFRSQYRIETILLGKTNGHISGALRQMLEHRRLSTAEIDSIRNDILTSTKHEIDGDTHRLFGDKRNAMVEYLRAARVEEVSFGRDNPDLAFLWRKMACLVAIDEEMKPGSINFDEADKMGNKWMKKNKDLSPAVCSLIKRGDNFYATLLYTHAIGAYYQASAVAPHLFQPLEPPKKKKVRKVLRKVVKSTDDVSVELKQLLKGEKSGEKSAKTTETVPKSSRTVGSSSTSKTTKRATSTRSLKPSSTSRSSIPTTKAEEVPVVHVSQTSAANTTSHSGSTANAKVSKMSSTKGSRRTSTTSKSHSRNHASDSSFVSVLTEPSRPPSEQQKSATSLIISSSRIRRTRPLSSRSQRSSRSAAAAYPSTKSLDQSVTSEKPKSDSYLSKIASRTMKVASKTSKMAKRQISRGAQGIKDHLTFTDHGPAAKRLDEDGSGGSDEKVKKTPKTSNVKLEKRKSSKSLTPAYNAMASPPPTPYIKKLSDTVQRGAQASLLSPSMSSSDDGRKAEKPKKATSKKSSSSSKSQKAAQFQPKLKSSTTSQHNTDSSNKSQHSWTPDFASTGSASLFDRADSFDVHSTTDDIQSLAEQSHMTTDDDIRQRFLNTSLQVAKSINATGQIHPITAKRSTSSGTATSSSHSEMEASEGSASLVELVANIQTMSSLLQRQTVRLQNKLSLVTPPGSPEFKQDKENLTPSSTMSQGTKDLYHEVHRLFQECDGTLSSAFAQLDKAAEAGDDDTSLALEEYHKTFALEKAFLEELRRKLGSILGSSGHKRRPRGFDFDEEDGASTILSSTTDNVTAKKNDKPSVTATKGKPLVPPSTAGQESVSGEQSEGLLSVVMEERSTPSSRQTKPSVSSDVSSSNRKLNKL